MTVNHAQTIQERDGVAVVIYTTSPCFGCNKTKQILDDEGIHYTAVNVQSDPAALEYVTKTLGIREAPVVIASTPDGDVIWSGLQPQEIRKHITHRADAA